MDATLLHTVPLAEIDRVAFDRTLSALLDYLTEKASPRQAALLRYLVTEEEEGRGDRVKAITIAQDVFGKDSSFDPINNSLVRVEIHRLRANIENFYNKYDGHFDYILGVPTGSYRISIKYFNDSQTTSNVEISRKFKNNKFYFLISALILIPALYFFSQYILTPQKPNAPIISAACPTSRPIVAVHFSNSGAGDTLSPDAAREQSAALQTATDGFPLATFYTDGSCDTLAHYDMWLTVVKLETGAAQSAALPRYRVSYRLMSRQTKKAAAQGEFENNGNDPEDRLPIVMAKVVNHLFDRFGIMVWEYIRETKQANAITGYECLALAYKFVSTSDRREYPNIENCMKRAVNKDGLEAYLHAMYAASMHYMIVENPDYQPLPTMAGVNAEIDKAMRLDPTCRDCLYVKTRMLRYSGNPTGANSLYYLNQIEKIWPYDALLLEHAAIMAGPYYGQWDRSEQTIARARATIGMQDEFSLYALNYALFTGDKSAALRTSKELSGIRVPLFAVEIIAAAQLSGDANLVAQSKKFALDIGIDDFQEANKILLDSRIEPRLTTIIQTHLAKAYGTAIPVS